MNPTVKKVLNITTLTLAALFAFPTIAILASWKALPGDLLYPTKRNLESVALRLTAGSYSTNTSLQSELLARRADEAIVLALKRSSKEGLHELKNQVQTVRTQVAAAPTQEKKQAAAKKAVAKLQESKTKLQQTHVTLTHLPPTTIVQQTTITQQIIHYIVVEPPPAPTPDPQDIIDDIIDTEDEIDDVIDDLTSSTPTPFAAPAAAPNPSPQSGGGNPFNNSQNPLGGGPPQNQGPSPTAATASGTSN